MAYDIDNLKSSMEIRKLHKKNPVLILKSKSRVTAEKSVIEKKIEIPTENFVCCKDHHVIIRILNTHITKECTYDVKTIVRTLT